MKKHDNSLKIASLMLAAAIIISSLLIDLNSSGTASIFPSLAPPYSPPDTTAVLEKMTPYLNLNDELVGWVDTEAISTAVAQTDDNEFYLTHSLSKAHSESGMAFMDTRCSITDGALNTVIYAGTPQNGNAFTSLWQYSSEEHLAENPTVVFSTLYETGTYEIYAVVKGSRLSLGDTVLTLCGARTEVTRSEFEQYIESVRNIASVKTESIPQYGDRLLTLCTYDTDENSQCIAVLAYLH